MKFSPPVILVSASLAAFSATAVYVAEGIFSRFDRAAAMIEQVPATLAHVEASTQKLRVVMDEFEAKVSRARAAMPEVGKELADTGAEVVGAMKRGLEATSLEQEHGRVLEKMAADSFQRLPRPKEAGKWAIDRLRNRNGSHGGGSGNVAAGGSAEHADEQPR